MSYRWKRVCKWSRSDTVVVGSLACEKPAHGNPRMRDVHERLKVAGQIGRPNAKHTAVRYRSNERRLIHVTHINTAWLLDLKQYSYQCTFYVFFSSSVPCVVCYRYLKRTLSLLPPPTLRRTKTAVYCKFNKTRIKRYCVNIKTYELPPTYVLYSKKYFSDVYFSCVFSFEQI